MAIRLTETRLRQIIREEASRLAEGPGDLLSQVDSIIDTIPPNVQERIGTSLLNPMTWDFAAKNFAYWAMKSPGLESYPELADLVNGVELKDQSMIRALVGALRKSARFGARADDYMGEGKFMRRRI